jgi:hypothetical protein
MLFVKYENYSKQFFPLCNLWLGNNVNRFADRASRTTDAAHYSVVAIARYGCGGRSVVQQLGSTVSWDHTTAIFWDAVRDDGKVTRYTGLYL